MSKSAKLDDIYDRGLAFDLRTLMQRRRMLGLVGFASAGTLLAACDFLGPPAHSEPNRTATAADGSTCLKLPSETNGPFPADGSNSKSGSTVNVLTQSGIVRADMRPSFGGMTPVAGGTQLDLAITILDVSKACVPLAGHGIYLWHCDVNGRYSLYDDPDRNYLRGVGFTDAKGLATFTTVFPGCYPGRWPHIHFEVFASRQQAASGSSSLLVSQFAMPGSVASSLYADEKSYASSVASLAAITIQKDNVFGDNTPEQIAAQTLKIGGSAAAGFKASATVAIAGS